MATVAGFVRWLKALRSLNAQRKALDDHATELGRLSARIDPLADAAQSHARALGAREREIRVLEATAATLQRDIGELTARLSSILTRIDRDGVDAQAVREGVRREIIGITEWLGRLDRSATQLAQADRDATDLVEANTREVTRQMASVRERLEAEIREVTRQMGSVRERLEAIAPLFPALPNLGPEHSAAWFHAAIEGAFRGSEAEIQQRLSVYLPFVTRLPRDIVGLHAVDIGCGRGEWLRVLNDAGLTAIGVDANAVSVGRCLAEGLKVIRDDAIHYLRGQADASLGVVSAFHVIEHLPTESLIALFVEAHRALAPGGLLLVETPNPDNVLVGSSSFYLDPTHRNPIPAPLLRVMVEFAKFDVVESLALQPNDEMRDLAAAEHWPATLVRLLAGPRDIGVVARKPGDGRALATAPPHA